MRRMRPPGKPLMVYDGDCGFCRRWIIRWRKLTRGRVDYAPYQRVAGRFPEIPEEAFAASVRLIEPDGRVTSGAEAVFRVLAYAPGRGWLLRAYRSVPGFRPAAELAYRFVAAHRPFFSRLTRRL